MYISTTFHSHCPTLLTMSSILLYFSTTPKFSLASFFVSLFHPIQPHAYPQISSPYIPAREHVFVHDALTCDTPRLLSQIISLYLYSFLPFLPSPSSFMIHCIYIHVLTKKNKKMKKGRDVMYTPTNSSNLHCLTINSQLLPQTFICQWPPSLTHHTPS